MHHFCQSPQINVDTDNNNKKKPKKTSQQPKHLSICIGLPQQCPLIRILPTRQENPLGPSKTQLR